MAWFRVALTEDEQLVVNAERDGHPDAHVRRKMLVLWLLHNGLSRQKAADIAGLGRATVQRYVGAYKDGGLDGLRRWGSTGPVSSLVAHTDVIRASLTSTPVRTIAEAADRIEQLTGIRRQLTQTRAFLKNLNFSYKRIRAIPIPPKKTLAEHVATQREFLETELKTRLDAAIAGNGHVLFADASHCVFGTYLCCVWSIARVFVRAASGRQRFNVLGAWDAVNRTLVSVTNTTVVNTDTMCELLRKIAAVGYKGPVTVVLDNARYQRNKVVQALAAELSITLLYLPSYSPNLNLIERLWRFLKRDCVYGKYHPNFASFKGAIEDTLSKLSTTHAEPLTSLMTLDFQEFENVSLLAA
jgi:transposase